MSDPFIAEDVILEESQDGRICAFSDCGADISGQHHFAKYCPEHAPATKPRNRAKPRGRRDSAPRSINVNLSSGRKSKDLEEVEAKAKQFAMIFAAIVMAAGQHDDAAAIANGAGPWAASVKGLAEHEKWLAEFLSGGETTGRVLAWVQFGTCTAAIVVPIMVRRGWLPEHLSALAAQVLSVDGQQTAAA